MLKCKLIILVLFLFLGSSHVFANSSNGSNRIMKISIHDTGHILLIMDGHSNSENCGLESERNIIVLHKDYMHFKDMYSMALMAFATDTEVAGWVNGCVALFNGTLAAKAITLGISR